MNGKTIATLLLLGCTVMGGTPTLAFAQEEHVPTVDARSTLEFDPRYHLNRYYPKRGVVTTALPAGSVAVDFRSGSIFFHAGAWFRLDGARFVVITPPLGVIVPMLPKAYVTIQSSGTPYYYADGVFYTAAASPGFAVSAPPLDAALPIPLEPAAPVSSAISAGTKAWPRTAEQAESDRADCTTWAHAQPLASSDDTMFQTGFDACMQGRGYAVHGR